MDLIPTVAAGQGTDKHIVRMSTLKTQHSPREEIGLFDEQLLLPGLVIDPLPACQADLEHDCTSPIAK